MARVQIGNLVEDKTSAISFAEELLQTSREHLSDDTNIEWNELSTVQGVTIEGAEVTGDRGPLKDPSNSNQLIRASITLGGITSQKMYEFLISKEGYIFIDPDADPNDFGKALMGPYEWGPNSMAQVEQAYLKLPFPLANRDYIVLNAFSGLSRSFLSASCYSPSLSTETSAYEDCTQKKSSFCGTVRMAFYGVYSVVDDENSSRGNSCILKVAQYVDMNGWTPKTMNRGANISWFKSFIHRAQERFPLNLPNEQKKER
uniref:START domain-containing protein n=1 Tax=Fibrocapsa japonica TaxID=94617 RepID=A0A7S2V840_9STRA|mmetsp:Transcript_7353/g.11067  ORF Transcript_7353/g.11067 Transcript_7353/m.11067 type:complete len:259 (+) Transcript_7353:28-804(+)